MAINCALYSAYLARRTPNFIKEFTKDTFPRDLLYGTIYPFEPWSSFHGTEFTWDRQHVNMPNDLGDWEQMRADDCAMQICNPEQRQIDWGSTRNVFGKFRRRWKTRVLCLDLIRHVEEAKQQLRDIWEGLAKVPEYVKAEWMKYQCTAGSNYIYSCGQALTTVQVTSSMFTAGGGLATLNMGSDANLPTSKLTMNYLQQYLPQLQYNGYFNGDWVPTGVFMCISDMQSVIELCNANPALNGMYQGASFEKGGEYFKYGAMAKCGNIMFNTATYPARFYRSSAGVLTRVMPFQNLSTTVGSMPVLDPQYLVAPYQLSHLPNRRTRRVFRGEIPELGGETRFGRRDLWGKWNWCNDPALVNVIDPTTGTLCTLDNVARNLGYWWLDLEAGIQNEKPELELMILHQRETTPVADLPRAAGAATTPALVPQSLLPYNAYCNPNPGEETYGGNAGISDFGGVTPED
jgi:hypothetical protein